MNNIVSQNMPSIRIWWVLVVCNVFELLIARCIIMYGVARRAYDLMNYFKLQHLIDFFWSSLSTHHSLQSLGLWGCIFPSQNQLSVLVMPTTRLFCDYISRKPIQQASFNRIGKLEIDVKLDANRPSLVRFPTLNSHPESVKSCNLTYSY